MTERRRIPVRAGGGAPPLNAETQQFVANCKRRQEEEKRKRQEPEEVPKKRQKETEVILFHF